MNTQNVFDYIGFFGNYLLLIITLFLLHKKKTLWVYYIIGYFMNMCLNFFLKGCFKHARPDENISIFKASEAQERHLHKYGMPSGHAQSVFFSTTFIFLSRENNYIKLLYLLIAFNTCRQRVAYKNHTILQIVVGAIVGSFFSMIIYVYATKKISGILQFKLEENAPI